MELSNMSADVYESLVTAETILLPKGNAATAERWLFERKVIDGRRCLHRRTTQHSNGAR